MHVRPLCAGGARTEDQTISKLRERDGLAFQARGRFENNKGRVKWSGRGARGIPDHFPTLAKSGC
jgi:hypothetical protein